MSVNISNQTRVLSSMASSDIAISLIGLAVLLTFLVSPSRTSAATSAKSYATESQAQIPVAKQNIPQTTRLPGVDLAEGITQITGVAISPLLGVSCAGVWHYFRTEPEHRGQLPIFCHPLFWGSGFLILVFCWSKDLIGVAAPPLVKKPFDVAEQMQNLASGALASTLFVPFVSEQITTHFLESPELTAGTYPYETGVANLAMTPGPFATTGIGAFIPLSIPLVIVFASVWFLSNVINVLILLSPFGFIDLLLKLFRGCVFGFLMLVSAFEPVLGAILCGIVIAVSAMLLPWAIRFTILGTVMAVDSVASILPRPAPSKRVYGFLVTKKGEKFPAGLSGCVSQTTEGVVVFTARRFFFGSPRTLRVAHCSNAVLQEGLFFPKISRLNKEGEVVKPTVFLLPRYRQHVHQVSAMLAVREVHENAMRQGIRAMMDWLKDFLAIGGSRPSSA